MGSISPFSTRKRRYATVVTQNPAGTGTPAAVSSPRLAPLPPTSEAAGIDFVQRADHGFHGVPFALRAGTDRRSRPILTH